MKLKTTCAVAGLLACALSAQAAISFDIKMGYLSAYLAPWGPLSDSSRAYLVADTNRDGFSVVPGTYTAAGQYFDGVGGDDLIVFTAAPTEQGSWVQTPTLSLSGNWDAGDPLAVVWVRSTTVQDGGLSGPTRYSMVGLYSGPGNPSGDTFVSDTWVTPADGTSGHKLYMLTPLAASVTPPIAGGIYVGSTFSLPGTTGNPSVHVVPEPAVSAALAGVLALILSYAGRARKR